MTHPTLFSKRACIVAVCVAALITGCSKQEDAPPPPYALPELNDANCRFDAIKAMPSDAQQKFADMCARRPKPIQSEKKSYNF